MIIALTQSEGRLEGLESLLRGRGHQVLRIPLVHTTPLAANLEPLADCPWWLFTSPAAVRAVVELGASLQGRKLGAVGESTALALRKAGGKVELIGAEGNAKNLAQMFLAKGESGPVGLPQGTKVLPALAQVLQEGGIEVRPVTVYQTKTLPWPVGVLQRDITLLASPSAVAALPESVAQRSHNLALGPTTAQALEERGWAYRVVESPKVESVFAAILQLEGELCST